MCHRYLRLRAGISSMCRESRCEGVGFSPYNEKLGMLRRAATRTLIGPRYRGCDMTCSLANSPAGPRPSFDEALAPIRAQAPGFCAHTLHQPAAGTVCPAKILQPATASLALPWYC